MALITIDKVSLAFGADLLLNKVSFGLETNNHYGLIGRNGAGKSSFLKLMAGELVPDEGKVYWTTGLNCVYVPQEPILNPQNTIFQEVITCLGDKSNAFSQYYQVLNQLGDNPSLEVLDLINYWQNILEQADLWRLTTLIEKTLSEFNLDGNLLISNLSGGQKKKVALCRAFINTPDVLLLDEPTNHLDINRVKELELILNKFKGALILITHDREFLDNCVNLILELDRGNLNTYQGNYASYRRFKDQELEQEAKTNWEFDKFLKEEEKWIRKGIEARRTRNEGRVRRLKTLREEAKLRRNVMGNIKFSVSHGELSGKSVLEIKDLNISYASKVLVRNFNTLVMRGDKIGLIGANGVGKTTLIRTILGELNNYSGEIKLGTKLEVAYFDQLRARLDLNKTLWDVIADGSEFVFINQQKKHIATYLNEFLFDSQRFRTPISALSGGERNRLLLAKLFAKPSNCLVLDEPTNDLDLDSLELLEELLQNYPGSVFLISHDRKFLDNVVTESWLFEDNGNITEIYGGYSEALNYLNQPQVTHCKILKEGGSKPTNKKLKTKTSLCKLSFKEKEELLALPNEIENLEVESKELSVILSDQAIYIVDSERANNYAKRLALVEDLISEKLIRWEELENK